MTLGPNVMSVTAVCETLSEGKKDYCTNVCEQCLFIFCVQILLLQGMFTFSDEASLLLGAVMIKPFLSVRCSAVPNSH